MGVETRNIEIFFCIFPILFFVLMVIEIGGRGKTCFFKGGRDEKCLRSPKSFSKGV